MNEKDIFKMLNYIDYSEEEIRELEEKAMESKNKYSENLYLIKNEKEKRRKIYEEVKLIVEEKTRKDEKIKFKGIFFNSLLREKAHRYPLSPGRIAPIYFALFVTNKRVFLYKLSVNYELIDETEYINDIENIEYIQDGSDFSETYEIAFNDKRKFQLRYFNEESKEILIFLASYLNKEKGIEIRNERVIPYHERFSINKFLIIQWIIFGYLIIYAILYWYKDFLELIK